MLQKKLPAYLNIKNAILQNIHRGLWRSGDAIPAEISLAEEFGVSRMTVNRALKELEAERVLERRQGSGTYVAQQKYNNTYIEIRNIAKDIIDHGQSYHAAVYQQSTLDFSALNLPENNWLKDKFFDNAPSAEDKVYHVSIIHYGDNIPVQFEERWVNARLIPEFNSQDFNTINTSDYLIAHVPLELGEYIIKAQLPPALIKEQLQMADGEPALLHRRRTQSQGDTVTLVNMWHAGSRFQLKGTV